MIEKLFVTEVGSSMWGMQRPDSDTDLFQVYVASTKDILRGTADVRSKFIQVDNQDIAVHEVGKVVEQLIKGNFNFLVGVMSPVVVESNEFHRELVDIVKNNVAKNCYHSIRGLAVHNYKKYIESEKDPSERRCNKIIRVLKFGVNLLRTREFVFKPIVGGTPEEVLRWLSELDLVYTTSRLPDRPDEGEFREWLYKVRLYDWGMG